MLSEQSGKWLRAGLLWALFLAIGCSNNPYPAADEEEQVLYLSFATAPKTLDPAVSYGTADTVVTNKVYDTLLEYHYLKRPYELTPSMAQQVPVMEELPTGQVRYTFVMHEDIFFGEDECFSLSAQALGPGGRPLRRVSARDILFQLHRIADPEVGSPVVETFAHVAGFLDFRKNLEQRRKQDAVFSRLPVHEQYAQVEGLSGATAPDDRRLIITLNEAYPQILFWFAMPFTTPVPWEAVVYYNGEGGRPPLSEHPVSTGAFVLSQYDKQSRIVLRKNPHWWGLSHQDVEGTRFPDVAGIDGADDMRDVVGRPLPFLDRIEYRREQEAIPAFAKFLQGYYDLSGISRESFDKVVREGGLSQEMKAKGMRLSRTVDPGVFYIGFNLEDAVVGTPDGERSKLLRQAMSLAVDVKEYLRLFSNGRGVPAHSPIPPGLFGYDEAYQNPYRLPNIRRAKELLTLAGYPGGIDPKTGSPLRLSFDVADTSAEGRVRYLYWVGQWRKLGINVELSATNYNQFYAKMLKGSYQIYTWGWMADYPDPENFLFLLSGKMARSVSGGPNNANFIHEEYDRLFDQMRNRENDEERIRLISEMLKILEEERPWIELFYPESYALVHGWMKNVRSVGISTIATAKYYELDVRERSDKRQAWNKPIYWPAWLLLVALLVIVLPAVWTYQKERT